MEVQVSHMGWSLQNAVDMYSLVAGDINKAVDHCSQFTNIGRGR